MKERAQAILYKAQVLNNEAGIQDSKQSPLFRSGPGRHVLWYFLFHPVLFPFPYLCPLLLPRVLYEAVSVSPPLLQGAHRGSGCPVE